ncbi:MAG: energy transducer TonB [Pseudomonadota bacterium]|nr:energy transducer TonB [Pseudomonadota bacterium]
MIRYVIAGFVSTLSFGSASAAQAKETVLEPSSQWNVDFATDKCRLARNFGEGDARHLLFFEQYFPGKELGMTLSGAQFDRFGSRRRTNLSFRADQKPLRTEPFVGKVVGTGTAVIYSAVDLETGQDFSNADKTEFPQLDTDFASGVEYVKVQQGGSTVTLKTGDLAEAFEVMNTCTQSLLEDWGLDPQKHLSSRSMPVWKNERSVTRKIQSTYPSKALRVGEQGIMRMRVMIDEAGTVTDCTIVKATRVDALESPACRAMLTAKSEPALDANGKPFPSYYATSITYQIGR